VAVVAGDCRGSPSLRRRGVGSPAAGGHVTRLVLKGLRLSGNYHALGACAAGQAPRAQPQGQLPL
jgi:hypothetical protein